MTSEQMTPADRELAQAAIMRLYLRRRGLDARSEWDRKYFRGGSGAIFERKTRIPSGSSPGAPSRRGLAMSA